MLWNIKIIFAVIFFATVKKNFFNAVVKSKNKRPTQIRKLDMNCAKSNMKVIEVGVQ